MFCEGNKCTKVSFVYLSAVGNRNEPVVAIKSQFSVSFNVKNDINTRGKLL